MRTIVLVAALALVAPRSHSQAPGVVVTFLDVGQGDAAVIQSPQGHTVLVDAGNDGEIVPLLDSMGIASIDLVIASHVDHDHTGGIESVIRSFPLHRFMDNGVRGRTQSYRRLMRTLAQTEIEYVAPVKQTIQFADMKLRILPPPGWRRSANDESIGVLVEYGEFRALLTGDSEVDELNYFLDLGVPDVTLLKAAHHGARNGVTPRWVDVTRPEVVVISVGANNSYGHPDPWALRYYEAVGAEIYRTDLHGHVAILGKPDGSYEVFAEHLMTVP